jgi:hypothetical protein
MAINFPTNPTPNQYFFDTTSGNYYRWNATKSRWNSVFGTSTIVPNSISVKDYGARGDTKEVRDVTIANGSVYVISNSANFSNNDIGKVVFIRGADSSNVLVTSIVSIKTTSNAQMQHAPASAANVTWAHMIYGTDDTLAIQNTIDAHKGTQIGPIRQYNFGDCAESVYLPSGMYLVSGLTVYARTSLTGSGFHESVLVMRPDTTSNCIKNSTVTDDFITIKDLGILGTGAPRGYLWPGSENKKTCHGISFIHTNTSGPEVDFFHRLMNLKIWNVQGDGFRSTVDTTSGGLNRGESFYFNINIQNCNGYGLNYTGVDSRFISIHSGGNGYAGGILYTESCQFIGCKFYYNGRNVMWDSSSVTHAASQGSNFIIGGWGNMFTSCQSEESVTNGFYIFGGKNQFVNCKSDDTGDVPIQESESLVGPVRAAFFLDGAAAPYNYKGTTAWLDYNAQDNYFDACHIGIARNIDVSYMTHAVFLTTGATFNKGRFNVSWKAPSGGGHARFANTMYEAVSCTGGWNHLYINNMKLIDLVGAFWGRQFTNADHTLEQYEEGAILYMNNQNADRKVTVPEDLSFSTAYEVPVGAEYKIVRKSATYNVSIKPETGSVTLVSKSNWINCATNGVVSITKTGANTWFLYGDLIP